MAIYNSSHKDGIEKTFALWQKGREHPSARIEVINWMKECEL